MGSFKKIAGSSLASMALVACSSGDSIDDDGETFDAVAVDAEITLLGTEPFWNIEIVAEGEGHQATYTTPDNPGGTAFAAERFAGNNGLGFSGEMDGKSVRIALTPGECSDAMSDRTYPYTATVKVGDDVLIGCGYTSDEPFEGEETP